MSGYAGYIRLHQFMLEGRDVELDNKTGTRQEQDRNKIRYMTGTRQEQNGHKIQLIEV